MMLVKLFFLITQIYFVNGKSFWYKEINSTLYQRSRQYRTILINIVLNRYPEALAMLDSFEKHPDVSFTDYDKEGLLFLKGYLFFKSKKFDESFRYFKNFSKKTSTFLNHCYYFAGMSLYNQNRLKQALYYLKKVKPFCGFFDDSLFFIAKIYEKLGKKDLKSVYARRYLNLVHGFPVKNKRKFYFSIKHGAKKESSLKGLYRAFRLRLKKNRKSWQRKKYLRKVFKKYKKRKGRYNFLKGVYLCFYERSIRGVDFLKTSVSYFKNSEDKYYVHEQIIECYYRNDSYEDGISWYLSLERRENLPNFEKISYKTAIFLLQRKRFEDAKMIAEDLLKKRTKSSYTVKTLWFIAFFYYLENRLYESEILFNMILKNFPFALTDGGVTWKEKILYWLINLHLKKGEKKKALTYFYELKLNFPNSYYSILINDVMPGVVLPELNETYEHLPAHYIFYNLGLNELVYEELEFFVMSNFDLKKPDIGLFLYLATVMNIIKPIEFFKLKRGIIPFSLVDIDGELLKPLFDFRFYDEVMKVSKITGVSPYLISAVIKKESLFEMHAVSSKGALGLMQIVPKTFEFIAKSFGFTYKRRKIKRILKDPQINIFIGAIYLKTLFENYNNLIISLLAYCMGPARVGTFLKKYENIKRADEFLEIFPYSTGRDYVIKIIMFYNIYSVIYGGKGISIDNEIKGRVLHIKILKKGGEYERFFKKVSN